MTAGCGHMHVPAPDNFTGLHRVTIDVGAGVVVGANGRAFERDPRKYSASAGIAENFSAHPGVCRSGRITSERTRSYRSVAAKLDLAAENGIHTAVIHNQQN